MEGGDAVAGFMQDAERAINPAGVIEDYEATHEFLSDLVSCLEPTLAEEVLCIMADPYPGYDKNRGVVGKLFSDIISGFGPGTRYDDELCGEDRMREKGPF